VKLSEVPVCLLNVILAAAVIHPEYTIIVVRHRS